jgi:hypothetical protein
MSHARKITSLLALALVTATSSEALAAGNANGLGEKGQLIVSADRLLPLFSHTYASTTDTQRGVELTHSRSVTGLSLFVGRNVGADADADVPVNVHTIPRIAFDITVIPRLTLGAAFAFGFGLGGTVKDDDLNGNVKTTRQSDAATGTAIGIAPRVGYILPLTDIFAFWPRGGVGIYSVSSSYNRVDNKNVVTAVKDSDTIISLDLDPQFAIVPYEHFFFHVGPLVNIPLSGTRSHSETRGTNKTTRDIDISLFHLGLSAGLGGWFNVF